MRIIGFTLDKISAQRKNPIKGKIDIKSNIDIKDIQKEKVEISENQAIKFDFNFVVDFEPKFASVEITGSVMALEENNESKDILKDWKKKKLATNIRIPLFNFIMDRCNLKALQIEEDLGLPKHVQFPRLSLQQKNSNPANYTG